MRWLAVLVVVLVGVAFWGVQHPSVDTVRVPFSYGQLAALPVYNAVSPSTLYFVGDVLLARDVERHLAAYGSEYPYQGVQAVFTDATAVIGNFEAAVPYIHRPTPDFSTSFSVAVTHLPALREAGFTHMSLANNHAFDAGADNYAHTRTALEFADIEPFGHPAELREAVYIETNDTVLAVLGISTVFESYADAELVTMVANAASSSDIQIAYVHWGDEYKPTHNADQAKLAELLIDAGVDMVIGHHPHVVQDIRVYKDKLILFSLGNFIFDQYFSPAVEEGLVVRLSGVDTWELDLIPVSSAATRAQPQLMNEEDAAVMLQDLATRSDEALKTAIEGGTIILSPTLAISPQLE